MPLLTLDRVLKIISTILSIISAAIAAFTNSDNIPKDDEDEG